MEMNRETLTADLLALEALAYDLYVNARFHMEEVRYWPVGSPERERLAWFWRCTIRKPLEGYPLASFCVGWL